MRGVQAPTPECVTEPSDGHDDERRLVDIRGLRADQLRQRVAFALSEILVVSLIAPGIGNQARRPAGLLRRAGAGRLWKFPATARGHHAQSRHGRVLDMLKNKRRISAMTLPNENYAP